MGFIKYQVPEPKALFKVLDEGVYDFFRKYKSESAIGDAISIQMLDDAFGMVKLKVDEDEIIEKIKEKYKYELGKEDNPM